MRFVKNLLLAVVCFCMLAGQALAADFEMSQKSTIETILKSGVLRVGLDPGYAPFEMTDKNGKVIGFDVDIAKELAKAMGVKLEVVNTDFDGIVPALLADKFDIIISGMTLTQERNLQISFADPYIAAGQAVLVNKKFEGVVKSYRDLNDPKYTVASRIGTTGEMATKRMMPKANYKSFDKEPDGAMDVANGQSDAFVYDLPFCVVFMAQQGGKNLFILDKPFTYEPIAMGIKRGDPDFLNFLNNFMKQIKSDGRYDRIYDKWIKSTTWFNNLQ
ncbi:polar amino acid transport system substrate-binding protein [Desulfobaculum xiamenense]|uniref:Polar amino acid transport system substrate-binding protein n=1 Tax=Desulfobaculum xiamenense TaxID=995050 RepID=A0A846QPM5_9BACT|nr:transporter substrate-binding domain-containing protein [Desulfobaculum xiamenense]NJB66659.1 polar amino acid transport system substrate-binding protein [Desulfobaculum xiamenense]